MNGMLSDLENMLFSLGLDDDQEKSLMQLADKATEQLVNLNQTTNDLDSELNVILESLNKYYDSHTDN